MREKISIHNIFQVHTTWKPDKVGQRKLINIKSSKAKSFKDKFVYIMRNLSFS